MVGNKRCTICKAEKGISYFYRDRSRGDGLQAKCKSCTKRYNDIRDGKPYTKTPEELEMETYLKNMSDYLKSCDLYSLLCSENKSDRIDIISSIEKEIAARLESE